MCREWPGSFQKQPHWVPVAMQGGPTEQVTPLDLVPGALGALAVGGLCLLAYFLFADFSLLTVLATKSPLMGG